MANNYLVTSNSSWASKLTEESTFTKCTPTGKTTKKRLPLYITDQPWLKLLFDSLAFGGVSQPQQLDKKTCKLMCTRRMRHYFCFPLTVAQMSCKRATTQDIYLHHGGLGKGLKIIYSTTCLKNCIAANTAVTYRIPGKIMVERSSSKQEVRLTKWTNLLWDTQPFSEVFKLCVLTVWNHGLIPGRSCLLCCLLLRLQPKAET